MGLKGLRSFGGQTYTELLRMTTMGVKPILIFSEFTCTGHTTINENIVFCRGRRLCLPAGVQGRPPLPFIAMTNVFIFVFRMYPE